MTFGKTFLSVHYNLVLNSASQVYLRLLSSEAGDVLLSTVAYCCKICVVLASHTRHKCTQSILTDKLLTRLWSFKAFLKHCSKCCRSLFLGLKGGVALKICPLPHVFQGQPLTECVTFNIFFSLWLLSNSQ